MKKRNVNIVDIAFIIYVVTVFLFTDDTQTLYISNYAFIAFAGVALAWTMISSKGKFTLHGLRYMVPIVAFSIISIPFARSAGLAGERAITLITLFVLWSILLNYLYNTNKQNIIPLSFVIGGFAVAIKTIHIYGISVLITGVQTGTRIGRQVLQLNYLGRYTYFAAVSSFYLAYYRGKKIFYFPCVIATLVCIGSGSRQAIISLLMVVLLLYLLYDSTKYKLKYLLRILVGVAFIIVVLQIPQLSAIRNRITTGLLTIVNADGSLLSDQRRLEMISLGLQLFKSNIIFGVGLNNVRLYTSGFIAGYSYLHNTYVELLATGGLIGFCAYYSIYVRMFKSLRNLRERFTDDKDQIFAMSLLVGQLVLDLFAVNYYAKYQYLIFAYVYLVLQKKSNAE